VNRVASFVVKGLMRVISLVAFILLPMEAVPAPQHFGTEIRSIEISGAPADALEAITLRPGDLLSPDVIRSSIQALYDAGQYGSIEVDAIRTSAGGTKLTFIVIKPSFFSTIRVEPSDLIARPLSSYVALPYGERFSRTQMDLIVQAVREQLRAEGFFQAIVKTSREVDEETRLVNVVLSVDVSPRARMGETRIDPFLVGAENDPVTRVTISEQITRDLTIMYSQDLSSNRQQIILIEYFLNSDTSFIASRDETGAVGLDIKLRKRFQ